MMSEIKHYLTNEGIQSISLHLCLFTSFLLLLRLRQTKFREGILGAIYQIALISLLFAYLQKGWTRMDGISPASYVDVWREFSFFAVIGARLLLGSERDRLKKNASSHVSPPQQ